jgi:hypothetical protein
MTPQLHVSVNCSDDAFKGGEPVQDGAMISILIEIQSMIPNWLPERRLQTLG